MKPRPGSNVLLRPLVGGGGAEPVKPSSGPALLPSIRSSGRDVISHVGATMSSTKALPALAGTAPKERKRGRPTKAEKMKERRARVSEGIKALVDDEPSKADVHAYFENRIKELLDEA